MERFGNHNFYFSKIVRPFFIKLGISFLSCGCLLGAYQSMWSYPSIRKNLQQYETLNWLVIVLLLAMVIFIWKITGKLVGRTTQPKHRDKPRANIDKKSNQ